MSWRAARTGAAAARTAEQARVWQQKRDEERSATRIEVRATGGRDTVIFGRGDEHPRTWVMVTVINHGDNSEYVDNVQIQGPRSDEGTKDFLQLHDSIDPPGPGPREVPPRGKVVYHTTIEPGWEHIVDSGVVGVARLSSGAKSKSPVGKILEYKTEQHTDPDDD